MKITINKKNSLYDIFRFVLSARAKKTARYSLTYLKMDKDYIVATDGQRLHVAYFTEKILPEQYKPGMYEVIHFTQKQIELFLVENSEIKFPDWQVLIPHYQDYFEISSTKQETCHFPERLLALLGKQNVSLQHKFLLPFAEIARQWQVYYGEPDRPVRFISCCSGACRIEAIIMPLDAELQKTIFRTKPW